jgi:hypothetical protein
MAWTGTISIPLPPLVIFMARTGTILPLQRRKSKVILRRLFYDIANTFKCTGWHNWRVVKRKEAVMTWRTIPLSTTRTKGNHENVMTAGVLPVKFIRLELKFRAIMLHLNRQFQFMWSRDPEQQGRHKYCLWLDILRLSETTEPRASSGLNLCHWTAHNTNITDTETF